MDFLDPTKKRQNTLLLFTGYILVAITILITTLILVFESYGYSFDRSGRGIIQNGLVFIGAHPENAAISLNGVQNKARTDARLVLPAGQYTIELKRDGYRSWKRVLTLDGGKVERLDYPILFPSKLTSKDVQQYASEPTFSFQSPDRRWVLVQQTGSISSFDEFDDANTSQAPISVTLPLSLLNNIGSQSWQVAEWASDNRHVLLKHNYQGGQEFVLMDRESPGSSVNLSKLFPASISDIRLHDKRADQLYVYDSTTKKLAAADVKTHTPTTILSNVLAFKTSGANQIVYATDQGAVAGEVLIKVHDQSGDYTLRNLPATGSYLLDITQFNGKMYVVAGTPQQDYVYIYKDPLSILKLPSSQRSLLPATSLKSQVTTAVSFSPNGQFVTAQSGQGFATYDIAADRRFYFTTQFSLDGHLPATWMDGYRLISSSGEKVFVSDFDGTNQQLLMATTSDQPVFFSRDYLSVETIAPSVTTSNHFALIRTRLKN